MAAQPTADTKLREPFKTEAELSSQPQSGEIKSALVASRLGAGQVFWFDGIDAGKPEVLAGGGVGSRTPKK